MVATSTAARAPARAGRRDAGVDAKLRRRVRELLHRDVASVEYPGGKGRDSIRLRLSDGRSVIATTRADLDRAMLEKRVLAALGKGKAPTPRLLGARRHLLFQEDLGGVRLSQALHNANQHDARDMLDAALAGLARVHKVASAAGLDEAVPERGHTEGWTEGLLRQPRIIGKRLGVETPRLRKAPLLARLAVVKPRFIKWDARPGTALLDSRGTVSWIDWEHAGSRNRLDDAAWLLADEYVADDPEGEQLLLERHLGAFADGLDAEDALDYLHTYGCYHSSVRLGYILRYFLRKNEWWDIKRCLRDDRIGVTLTCAQTVCRRAARWASGSSLAHPLEPWFLEVERKLDTL